MKASATTETVNTAKTQLKPSPITQIDLVEATPGHIALLWQPVTDAKDYKVYWDKGDHQQTALYFPLVNSTGGANQLEV